MLGYGASQLIGIGISEATFLLVSVEDRKSDGGYEIAWSFGSARSYYWNFFDRESTANRLGENVLEPSDDRLHI